MTGLSGKSLAVGVLVLLLVAVLVFAGYGWLNEHDSRLKAQTQGGEQQRQIDTLKQQQVQNARDLALKVMGIEKERAKPATAAEMIATANRLIPQLPEALQVASVRDPALPDAPTKQTVVIPEADFQSIRDAQLTCEEDAAKLASCQTQQSEVQQQLAVTTAQREEWKTAAKGGSVWHRAIGAAKWFVIGAGTGAVVLAVAHHK